MCDELVLLGPDADLEKVGLELSSNLVSVGDHGKMPGCRDSTHPWRGFEYCDIPDDETEALSIEAVPEADNLSIGGVEARGCSASSVSCKIAGSNTSDNWATPGSLPSDDFSAKMVADDSSMGSGAEAPSDQPHPWVGALSRLLRYFPFFFFNKIPSFWLAGPDS